MFIIQDLFALFIVIVAIIAIYMIFRCILRALYRMCCILAEEFLIIASIVGIALFGLIVFYDALSFPEKYQDDDFYL